MPKTLEILRNLILLLTRETKKLTLLTQTFSINYFLNSCWSVLLYPFLTRFMTSLVLLYSYTFMITFISQTAIEWEEISQLRPIHTMTCFAPIQARK